MCSVFYDWTIENQPKFPSSFVPMFAQLQVKNIDFAMDDLSF